MTHSMICFMRLPDISDIVKASENGYYNIVKYMIGRGDDVTLNHNEAIRKALYRYHFRVADLLHENGADPLDNNQSILECICNRYRKREQHEKIYRFHRYNPMDDQVQYGDFYTWDGEDEDEDETCPSDEDITQDRDDGYYYEAHQLPLPRMDYNFEKTHYALKWLIVFCNAPPRIHNDTCCTWDAKRFYRHPALRSQFIKEHYRI